ncbi:hypothetical protein [Helicobacter salomonis]|uniref:hypothetical protein n=1 Tax=Helicobacter salomonis TaxID=56878 RepID=UPI000CF1203C|nr:hypothetical protein [Helicobacter salomonis]
MQALARFVYKRLLNAPNRVVFKLWTYVHRGLLKLGDPQITLTFRGVTFTMPFAHPVFICQKYYPCYDTILKGIAQHIKDRYGRLSMVDVGANIGDTAVFAQVDGGAYMLVEGTTNYGDLIHTNLSQNLQTPLYTDQNHPKNAQRYYTKTPQNQEDKSFLVYTGIFLGESNDSQDYSLRMKDGTASLVRELNTQHSTLQSAHWIV